MSFLHGYNVNFVPLHMSDKLVNLSGALRSPEALYIPADNMPFKLPPRRGVKAVSRSRGVEICPEPCGSGGKSGGKLSLIGRGETNATSMTSPDPLQGAGSSH